MSKLIILAVNFAGKMIENGRWEIEAPPGFQQDQTIALSIPIKDPALIKYLGKQQSMNCVVDKEDDDSYVVSVACKVMRIRHMINTQTRTSESLAYATPEDRTCEAVLLYLLSPKKCDPKFVAIVRGIQPLQPSQT